jgi:hypothetical protein
VNPTGLATGIGKVTRKEMWIESNAVGKADIGHRNRLEVHSAVVYDLDLFITEAADMED